MVNSILDSKLLNEIKEKINSGTVPQWLASDPKIYEMELEKIFPHTWHFLGHESELKKPGDYVTRWIVNDPILLLKNKEGEIKAFLNSCTHRGVHLCTANLGNKKTFTCPFHGWTYDLNGELIGVVAGDKFYGESMDRSQWGLRPIPRVESYQGMIFANLDPHADSLEEYLGGMKWYLDIMVGRSGGMEVRGVPQRWVVNTHWKQGPENFVDPYHAIYTHRSTAEIGIRPDDPLFSAYGNMIVLENGHGVAITNAPPGIEIPPFQGLPKELWEKFEQNLTTGQLEVLKKALVSVGTVFPNLSWVSPVHKRAYNYVNFRVWRPLGPDKIEICSWFMIDKDAPEEYKEASYKAYVTDFGPSGILEQDDTEIWTRVTDASKGYMARNKDLQFNNVMNYLLGIDAEEPDTSWPGPGTAYSTTLMDAVNRSFYSYWISLLEKEYHTEKEEACNTGGGGNNEHNRY